MKLCWMVKLEHYKKSARETWEHTRTSFMSGKCTNSNDDVKMNEFFCFCKRHFEIDGMVFISFVVYGNTLRPLSNYKGFPII